MDTWIIETSFAFNTAHHLTNHNGKCKRLHGHRYETVIRIKAHSLQEKGSSKGMVLDFTDIKKLNKELEDFFDHKIILQGNDLSIQGLSDEEVLRVPFRTTTENIAKMVYNTYKELLALKKITYVKVEEVRISETPNNTVIYRKEN